jgi:hypothetical protein
MNRKIVFPLIFILIVVTFSSLGSVFAQEDVGVSVGDVFQITYGYSGTARYQDDTINSTLPYYVESLETNTIEAISGTNVSFRVVRDMLNGTQSISRYWIDVSTGEGTAWLVVIAPNLGAGDMLYPNWVNENQTTDGAFTANETVRLSNGGSFVDAVHLNRIFTDINYTNYYQYDYYWEQSTGLLLKATLAYSTIEDETLLRTLYTQLQTVGLEQVFYPYIDNTTSPVSIDSNSELLRFEFYEAEKTVSFDVSGLSGTSGRSVVKIPADFLKDPFTLDMDGYPLVRDTAYTLGYNGTHYIFTINYIHSTHTIDIVASEVNPEDPTPSEQLSGEPTEPEQNEPEPTDGTTTISTEQAIIIAVVIACIIGLVSYWALKRK